MARFVKEYAEKMLKRIDQQKRRREKRSQLVSSIVSDEEDSPRASATETGTPLKKRRVVLDDSDSCVCLSYRVFE